MEAWGFLQSFFSKELQIQSQSSGVIVSSERSQPALTQIQWSLSSLVLYFDKNSSQLTFAQSEIDFFFLKSKGKKASLE